MNSSLFHVPGSSFVFGVPVLGSEFVVRGSAPSTSGTVNVVNSER